MSTLSGLLEAIQYVENDCYLLALDLKKYDYLTNHRLSDSLARSLVARLLETLNATLVQPDGELNAEVVEQLELRRYSVTSTRSKSGQLAGVLQTRVGRVAFG